MNFRRLAPALAIILAASTAGAARGDQIFAIGDGGASLLSFDSASPGTVSKVAFAGGGGFLDSIDFRTGDQRLYGYDSGTNAIYTVNLANGQLTSVSTPTVGADTFTLGIDFNPQVIVGGVLTDRLRIVTESAQNLRVNVATGATNNDAALEYAVGDINENSFAQVVEAAYTNNDLDAGTPTQLYYIDHGLNILATTGSPNLGILNTVGSLGVDTSEFVGFDIQTVDGGANNAFALLTVGGVAGLYSINLSTGAATALGALGADATEFGPAFGLALRTRAVPEPGSLALMGVGILGAIALARRRKSGSLRA